MVNSLFNYSKPKFWFFFHVGLGIVSAFSPFPLILFFYTFLFLSASNIFKIHKVDIPLSYLIIYLTSFELLARMAQTSPYIPYELGKYLLMILLVIGILRGENKGFVGLVMLLLLMPALFYDFSGNVTNIDIRFNLLGSLNIGLAIWHFYKQRFTETGIKKIVILLLLPLISVLSYTIFKTPDLDSLEFSLSANFATAGGFGSNQVATILGLGMMLVFFSLIKMISISGFKIVDLLLFFLFAFQGLLTFSRGGLFGGLIGILTIVFFPKSSKSNLKNKKSLKYLIALSLLLFLSFAYVNKISDGLLFLRYSGETIGTQLGVKEKNLNTLTSNRYNIFLSDIDLFNSYGILGVGAGASRFLRKDYSGVVSHIELSRLIAEHGLLGVIFNCLIIYIFILLLKIPSTNQYKGLLLAFFIVAWYTSFHAATRTYITPLLIGLSLITIRNAKNSAFRN